MTTARIYRPERSPTQSGQARTKLWMLEFEPERAREIEPLMGWTSSGETRQQIQLLFDTKAEAVAYATREGMPFRVDEPVERAKRKGLSYSDNFKFNRVGPWTH